MPSNRGSSRLTKHLVFCLWVVMVMLAYISSLSGRPIQPVKRVVAQCLAEDQVAKTVVSLSCDYDEAQSAQDLLRQSAKRSSACRKQTIAAVMKAMDKPDLDISRDQASANLWREGSLLLGDLRATESLDLLLSHIKMTDGEWSTTMTHQPALEGIIRIGPAAIPKLKNLLRNEDWQSRHYAVFCLASIGGLSGLRAIQTALPAESHPCVKRLMLVSVKTIDVKQGGLKQDHGEWFKAFMCMS